MWLGAASLHENRVAGLARRHRPNLGTFCFSSKQSQRPDREPGREAARAAQAVLAGRGPQREARPRGAASRFSRSCSTRSVATDVQSPVAQKPRGGFASGRPGWEGSPDRIPTHFGLGVTAASSAAPGGARGQACPAVLGAETRRARHTPPPQRSTPHSESSKEIKAPEGPGRRGRGRGRGRGREAWGRRRKAEPAGRRPGGPEGGTCGPGRRAGDASGPPTPTHPRGSAHLRAGAAGCRRFRESASSSLLLTQADI